MPACLHGTIQRCLKYCFIGSRLGRKRKEERARVGRKGNRKPGPIQLHPHIHICTKATAVPSSVLGRLILRAPRCNGTKRGSPPWHSSCKPRKVIFLYLDCKSSTVNRCSFLQHHFYRSESHFVHCCRSCLERYHYGKCTRFKDY